MKKIEKNAKTCGADRNTPSISEYFTWLNNTNEGSDEKQTLINLDFFAYLKRTYGMTLDVYAWDAGNMDGALETYADFDGEKLKAQYPQGYGNVVRRAAEIGTRMGVWGGTDGYGKTKQSEKARRDMLVGLCKNHNFALFKFDRACGTLRRSKRKAFAETMRQCREYSPDLVLLLHRNKVGKAEIYATTELWQKVETYVDCNSLNAITAMHNRAFCLVRGLTPDLNRLMEDHGVCISSCNDYFEDDLIMQAFGRCLILAPEIYGNPFLLRDDEYAMMARIFNLHRTHRNILVNGKLLPASYGPCAVSRGDANRRFIVLGNPTWQTKKVAVNLGEEIGLENSGKKFAVISRFPYESTVGIYPFGAQAEIEVLPFRAALIEVVREDMAEQLITGVQYLTLHEAGGVPDVIKVVSSSGNAAVKTAGKTYNIALDTAKFDHTEKAPVYLGSMQNADLPVDDRFMYETAMFAVNNDSLELQSLRRAGKTQIAEVQRARDAFFSQPSYKYRGCESSAMFDGNEDTFFDTFRRALIQRVRIKNGCMRVDLGREIYADSVCIQYFSPAKNVHRQTQKQTYPKVAEYSTDLHKWQSTKGFSHTDLCKTTAPLIVEPVNNTVQVEGKMCRAEYVIKDKIRYFVLPEPMYRVYDFSVMVNGEKVQLDAPKANNLMATYRKKATKFCSKVTVKVPEGSENCFIAVAVNGKHGKEGVYCVAEAGGKTYGMDLRAPSFPVNKVQHETVSTASNNTYYINVKQEMCGKEVTLWAMFNKANAKIGSVDVYLCPRHLAATGVDVDLNTVFKEVNGNEN